MFLGLANYFEKGISHYALIKLLRKDAPFFRGEEKDQAFLVLKEALINAPILAIHETAGKFKFQSESDYIDGVERVVKYATPPHPTTTFQV